jgi:hypothetical protein
MDSSLAIEAVLDKLPVAQLDETLSDFIAPFAAVLPDARLRQVVPLAVRGIVAGESPIVTAMAQSVARGSTEEEKKKNAVWAAAKRIYRFLGNPRLSVDLLQEGLYERARATIEEEKPKRVVVALDPVNFEKPYTRKLEGVSTIYKSTPPDRHGKARLARGYPAITATVVNTRVPATTYANWFSYTTDFISENREIRRAIDSTRRVFPRKRLRFVGDSGLDDKKIFEWIASATEAEAEFVIRASHLNRRVEVYNRHLDRWESESLKELVRTVPFAATWQVAFTHAGKTRLAEVKVGWLRLRLPEETDQHQHQHQHQHQQLWAVVAEEYDVADKAVRTLVLLTSVPVVEVAQAQELYEDWRLRGRIEHGYRFCQEAGLDVEDMQVRSVGRMRRLFILVLLAAQFVMHLTQRWPATGVRWLRLLGGKLGLQIDRDGPYILLRGLSAVWQTVATLTHLAIYPFPHEEFR